MTACDHRTPALLVAAPASGQGKTTVVAALARLHVRQGRRVRVFKCGPDFLDPFWLELASGAPVHNLDFWMTGEHDCRARLHAAAADADLILIEGVMGLYDGQPSAADLARHFNLPVLAVIDASAMATTFGAVAHGLRHYQAGLRWAGVLANRVAGPGHAELLRMAICASGDTPMDAAVNSPIGTTAETSGPFMGALPRDPRFEWPERHLGLVAARELPDALERLDAAADALAATPLGRMADADWARFTVTFTPPPDDEPEQRNCTPAAAGVPLHGRVVAVARDAAFNFVYPANLEVLRALGAQLVEFSPMNDVRLPPCDAVWLPGGYPELHADVLSANAGMRESLRRHVDRGRAVWAECGGMMVLFENLVDGAGASHPMWGLLPGTVTVSRRLAALGPQQWAWGEPAEEAHGRIAEAVPALRGHTFHFSHCETPWPVAGRTSSPDGRSGEAVYRRQALVASYFHAWFASSPLAVAQLFLGGALPQPEGTRP